MHSSFGQAAHGDGFGLSPAAPNAVYSPQQNSITIPVVPIDRCRVW